MRGELSVEDVLDILGASVKLLGVVPDDESIITSTNRGEPAVLKPSSKAGNAYINVSRRLRGEDVPLPAANELEATAFASLFGSADQREGMAAFLATLTVLSAHVQLDLADAHDARFGMVMLLRGTLS